METGNSMEGNQVLEEEFEMNENIIIKEEKVQKKIEVQEKPVLYKLKPLKLFNEVIDAGENKEYEDYFSLTSLTADGVELLVRRNRSWSTEITTDEEEYILFNNLSKKTSVEDLLTKKNTSIVIGDSGTGKTCLLHHLYNLNREKQIAYMERDKESMRYSNKVYLKPPVALFLCAKLLCRYFLVNDNALSFVEIIATVATYFLDLRGGDIDEQRAREEKVKNRIVNLLLTQNIILLIDNLELLPIKVIQNFIKKFTKRSLSLEGIKHSQQILSINTQSLQVLEDRKGFLFSASKDYELFYLTPGTTFDILSTQRITPLLNRWKFTDKLQGISPNFENMLRSHRIKFYPDHVTSPILLYSITWKLAESAQESIEFFKPNSQSNINLFVVMESIFDSCIRKKYFQHIQNPIQQKNNNGGSGGGGGNNNNNNNNVMNHEKSRTASSISECKLLIKYDIDIAQLKRLCSLVGFLAHWCQPSSVCQPNTANPANKNAPAVTNPVSCLTESIDFKYDHYFENFSQIDFISAQLQNLLLHPGIANLMGFNIEEKNVDKHTRDSESFIRIQREESIKLLIEIFLILSNFYTLTEDGNAKCIHPTFQEFLAARFITDNAYYTSTILNLLLTSITTSGTKIFLRPFDPSKSFILTSWRWEWVLLYSSIRRGLSWFADKIYDFNSKKKDDKLLDNTFKSLLKSGSDVNDLGQIRLQYILRSYALVCIYRTKQQNSADPMTESISQLFVRLLEQSASVLIHLEVYPNYFLATFTPTVASLLLKKCFGIFTSKMISHSISMISKLMHAPQTKTYISDSIELALKSTPKIIPGVVSLLKKVDDTLEKSYISFLVQFLPHCDSTIRTEITTFITSIGVRCASQISPSLLVNLFHGGNVVPYIAESNKIINTIVETSITSENTFQHPDKRIVEYYKNFSTLMALIEQQDPGAQLLAFLIFGSSNFSSDDNEDHGKIARKAAFFICLKLHKFVSGSLIFNTDDDSNNFNNPDFDPQETFENFVIDKAYYSFTVSLNKIITETLGEQAACWVSSLSRMLVHKRDLIRKVNARAFRSLPPFLKREFINEMLLQRNVYSLHNEIIKMMLLTPVDELKDCVDIVATFLKTDFLSQSHYHLKQQTIQLYGRIGALAHEKSPLTLLLSLISDCNSLQTNGNLMNYRSIYMNDASHAFVECSTEMFRTRSSMTTEDVRSISRMLMNFSAYHIHYFAISSILEILPFFPASFFQFTNEKNEVIHLKNENALINHPDGDGHAVDDNNNEKKEGENVFSVDNNNDDLNGYHPVLRENHNHTSDDDNDNNNNGNILKRVEGERQMTQQPIISCSLIVDMITRGNGYVRFSIVSFIERLCRRFNTSQSEEIQHLLQHLLPLLLTRNPLVKGTAVAIFIAIARNGFSGEVDRLLEAYLEKEEKISSSFVESVIRIITQLQAPISVDLRIKIAQFVHTTPNNRVTVSYIDLLPKIFQYLEMDEHEEHLLIIMNYLQHEDSEIRSASENALEYIKKGFYSTKHNNNDSSLFPSSSPTPLSPFLSPSSLPQLQSAHSTPTLSFSTPPQRFISLLMQCLSGSEYYQREAAVRIFEFFGDQFIVRNYSLYNRLLVDAAECVRVEALKVLTPYIPKIVTYFQPSLLQLLEDKNENVKTACLKLFRRDDPKLGEFADGMTMILAKNNEDPKVRLKALISLSNSNFLTEKHVAFINDLMRICSKDTNLLADMSSSLVKCGYALAKLVPKLIIIMKLSDQSVMKRKLLRLLKPHENQLAADYLSVHPSVMLMVADNDSNIRRKAFELMSKFICIHLRQTKANDAKPLIRDFVKCLTTGISDKNSLVRKEVASGFGELGKLIPSLRNELLESIFATDEDPSQSIIIWRLLSLKWSVLIRKPPKLRK